MLKKIIYVVVAIFFGIAIFYINYATDQSAYKVELIKNALENEEYETIPRLFGGLFDSVSIVNDSSDKFELKVYPGTERQIVEYEDEKGKYKYENFENAYYFYLFNAEFPMNKLEENKEYVNKASFRFYSGENKYDYKLAISKTINSKEFNQFPKTIGESVLDGYRNLVDQDKEFNILHTSFTSTMLNEIEARLGGEIDSYALVDNEGNEVYKDNISLSFNDAFFTHVSEMVTITNDFFHSYDSSTDKKEKQRLVEKYENDYNAWLEDFKAKGLDDYLFRFTNAELVPSNLKWKSIGPLIGYAVGAILLYIVIFHRKQLKDLGYRLFKKENHEDEYDKPTNTSLRDDMIDVDNPKNKEKR